MSNPIAVPGGGPAMRGGASRLDSAQGAMSAPSRIVSVRDLRIEGQLSQIGICALMSAPGLRAVIPAHEEQTVQNSRTFRTFLTARPVNLPGHRKKYRRDTDVLPTYYRQGFSLLTQPLTPDSRRSPSKASRTMPLSAP